MEPPIPTPPSDLEDPLYHIEILRLMINELPVGVSVNMLEQLAKIVEAINARNKWSVEFLTKFKDYISDELSDISMHVKYSEFDLAATKQERDALQKRLDGAS